MDKSEIVNKLCEITQAYCNGETEVKSMHDLLDTLFASLTGLSIGQSLEGIASKHNFLGDRQHSQDLKFLSLCFHLIDLLNERLEKYDSDVLSVQETKTLKNCMKTVEKVGILNSIQPNLPLSTNRAASREPEVALRCYDLLKYTVDVLVGYVRLSNLRMLILPHCLQGLLVGVYQLGRCPLKRVPDDVELYRRLSLDQVEYRRISERLRREIHPAIYVRETMSLFRWNAPIWLKKSISATLTDIMRSETGLATICRALLAADDANDTANTWRIVDILTKLVLTCRKFDDFQSNIVAQLLKLAETENTFYERLLVNCTKTLHLEDQQFCDKVFLSSILQPFTDFTTVEKTFANDQDVTNQVSRTARLINAVFIEDSVIVPCIPCKPLDRIINIVFYFYQISYKNSVFRTLNNDLKSILEKFITSCSPEETTELFDSFIFGMNVAALPRFRGDILLEVDRKISVKHSTFNVVYTALEAPELLSAFLSPRKKFALYKYLIRCVMTKDKYFALDVLGWRNEAFTGSSVDWNEHPIIARLISVEKFFECLSRDDDLKQFAKDNTELYVELLGELVDSNHHRIDSTEMYTAVMVLLTEIENLVKYGSFSDKSQLLREIVKKLSEESPNSEIRNVCARIGINLDRGVAECNGNGDGISSSALEEALHDFSDPLLPVRGHSLLTLTKLIERRDKQALENKYKLLTLFQIALKDDDSFIYLNSIGGLAAMADLFPDTILEVLCEEFVDFTKKRERDNKSVETRMKVGEILVRVVKMLGEMAPKYKSLLLNTFLCGVRDEDELIRASSLSNLAEVCRVLGYKLGTIVNEILSCVHAIVATDKSAAARRAAVSVLRQLFAGLEGDVIDVLKDDILYVYRTLKDIYHNDRDDVVKLQAQLALEELNENVKKLLLVQPKLHFDKKVLFLN